MLALYFLLSMEFSTGQPIAVDESLLKEALKWDEFKDAQKKKVRAAGGYSAAAFPLYMEWLNSDPPLGWATTSRILRIISHSEGERACFRPVVVSLTSNEKMAVSVGAIQLLEQIGTEDTAPAVAAQLRRKEKDSGYYYSIVKTLTAIGTEKEIELLDEMKETGLLKDDGRFWMKVADCKKAIQARTEAKKKLKAKGVNDK